MHCNVQGVKGWCSDLALACRFKLCWCRVWSSGCRAQDALQCSRLCRLVLLVDAGPCFPMHIDTMPKIKLRLLGSKFVHPLGLL